MADREREGYEGYESRRVAPPFDTEASRDDRVGGRSSEADADGRRRAVARGTAGGTTRGDAREGIRGRGAGSEKPGQGLYGSQLDGSNVLKAAVAELIGTFILVFTGTAVATAALLERTTAGAIYDSLAVALAFGLVLVAIVAAIGHISGAHVNPAVTLGLAATGKFPWGYVPAYVGAQLLGGLLGAVATWVSYGPPARALANVAATYPTEGVGDLRAFVVEALITFILVFVVLAVATDERVHKAVAPIAVGFALAAGVFIAGPVTGGSVNPARTLGPMLVAGRFEALWVYLLAPIVGGILAAFLYDRFLSDADAPS